MSATTAEVDALIGQRLRVALAQCSSTVYIPLEPKPDSPLAKRVGLGAAHRLANVFGGNTLSLQNDSAQRTSRRNESIRELAALGMSRPELARRFALTCRQIGNILKSNAKK